MKPQLFTYQHSAGFDDSIMKAVTKRLSVWASSKYQVDSLHVSKHSIVMTTLCDTKTHNKTCRLLAAIADKFVLTTL